MRWFKYCKFLMVCCLVAVFSGCEEDDDYRGYMLSGRWFGNIGMIMDIGVRAILTVTVPMSGVTAYKFIRRFRNV